MLHENHDPTVQSLQDLYHVKKIIIQLLNFKYRHTSLQTTGETPVLSRMLLTSSTDPDLIAANNSSIRFNGVL